MIQNDIDLLEEISYRDPYYFCLRLLSLKKNRKKNNKIIKNCHFKFLIEQDNQIVDQTPTIEDAFWIMRTTSISLNKESLNFFLPDINQSNSEFEFKMYLCTQQDVEQLATFSIGTLTYIEVFLEDGKSIFKQTLALCQQYTLQYEIYLEKSKIQLENLIKFKLEDNSNIKNPFKKKISEIIEIQNEKVQIKNKSHAKEENNILRKSLYFNNSKLMQVKKKKQQLKSKQNSMSQSRTSFLSKIGGIFKQSLNDKSESQSLDTKQKQRFEIGDVQLQKSVILSPPVIGPHKYNRPQNKFYYHRVNIERQKQRQRVKKQRTAITSYQINYKQANSYTITKLFKIIFITLIIVLAIYYLSGSGLRGKTKWLKKMNLFKF